MKKGVQIAGIMRFVVSFCLCGFLIMLSVRNRTIFLDNIQKLIDGENNFAQMKEGITKDLESSEFQMKYDLINVNGFAMRLFARRTSNETTLMKNGMLTENAEEFLVEGHDASALATGASVFSEYLNQMGIPFLYVQAPCKADINGELLQEGLTDYANHSADVLLQYLSGNGVWTLDLRSQLSANKEQVEQSFYRTDHHWTPDGAMAAFSLIVAELKNKDPNMDGSFSDVSLWDRHTKEDWFLGRYGKRVGCYFAGVDPLIWYTPKFETAMSCIIPHKNLIFKGSFEEANIRSEYIEQRDYFNLNNYCVYIGGDYPLVKHLNPKAPNKKKVLILKDSFMLPLQAFMSTLFTEVDVIDQRHYKSSTVAEYCRWNHPDIVIMMINPFRLSEAAFSKFGVSAEQDIPSTEDCTTLLSDYDLIIPAKENGANSYKQIPIELEPGHIYSLSFSTINVLEGKTDGVRMTVQNKTNQKVLHTAIFDVGYSTLLDDRVWTFRIPEEQEDMCHILAFAGLKGNNAGIGVEYSDLQIQEITETIN